MRRRLLLAAVCIFSLPIAFSLYSGDNVTDSVPFATVALAGHTTAGSWCECGTPGCVCDPGEEQTGHSARPVSDKIKRPVDQGASPIRSRSGFDFGTGVLMVALALFVWTRLRA